MSTKTPDRYVHYIPKPKGPMKLVAYCDSYSCIGKSMIPIEIPEAKREDIDCPRCSSALFWQRIPVK